MTTELSPAVQAMIAKSSVTTVDEMESGGGGVPRISLKKSKFTAKNGDEEFKLGDSINVVIVGITPPHGFSHTYYESGYTPGSVDAPDCQSTDGVRPDTFVSAPEAEVCAKCPKQVWGSAVSMSGGKAKACKDSKRLYINIVDDEGNIGDVTYLLTVTVMSLKPFGTYGKLLASEGIPTPAIVLTKLAFDEEASVPKLTFELLGVMNDDIIKQTLAIAETKAWDQVIKKPVTAMPQATEKPALEGNTDDAISGW